MLRFCSGIQTTFSPILGGHDFRVLHQKRSAHQGHQSHPWREREEHQDHCKDRKPRGSQTVHGDHCRLVAGYQQKLNGFWDGSLSIFLILH